jgi:hypothetical protein
MDKETIKQIAAEIVAQLPFGNRTGPFLVSYVIVTAVPAGFAAWFGSFLKTKGQNFATKQDFAELQKQLRANTDAVESVKSSWLKVNTELVETIKSEVGQRDWARREWTNLLRLKLEALFDKMHKCEADLERRRLAVFNRSPLERERDYLSELDTISSLYLPELVIETAAFSRECRSGHIAVLRLDQALYNAGDDGAARKRAYDDFNETWGSEERLRVREALRDAARTFLKGIMGVTGSGSGLTS